jgi:hypothetical protein
MQSAKDCPKPMSLPPTRSPCPGTPIATAAVALAVPAGSPHNLIPGVGAFAAGVNLTAQLDAKSLEKIAELERKEGEEKEGAGDERSESVDETAEAKSREFIEGWKRKRASSPIQLPPPKKIEGYWIWLIVSYDDHILVKRMGAIWDYERGQWRIWSDNKNVLRGKTDRYFII